MIAREDHYMKPGMLESQFESLEEPDNAIVADISHSPHIIASQIEKEIAVIAGVKR
jgi:gluconokinase